MRLERERKGKEKGHAKEEGKHIEELKSDVKKARETVEETKSRLAEAHGVVEAARQAYFSRKGMGTGSKKDNAAVAAATFLGEGHDPRDIPLNERWGARTVIGPSHRGEQVCFEESGGWC